MKREEALKLVKSMPRTIDEQEALRTLIPELRESEDERMIKSMTRLVKAFYDCNFPTPEGFEREDMLTWIERQKEPLPVPDKFSGLKSLMLQYLQSAVNRKDDTEIESDTDLFGRKILDYVWKQDEKQKEQKPSIDEIIKRAKMNHEKALMETKESVERTIENYMLKESLHISETCKKNPDSFTSEQKPAEWSEEDEALLKEIVSFFKDGTVKLQHDLDLYAGFLENRFKSLCPQPKHEWSEEDSRILYNVIAYVGYAAGQRGVRDDLFKEANGWLKSLPERFNLQPKQEWSEEDSKRYISIGTTLETSAVLSKEDYDANMVWLRDLVNSKKYSSPQPHWKPSKEQMEALKRCVDGWTDDGDGTLDSLYEQLKSIQ